jgi:hypothetical protein
MSTLTASTLYPKITQHVSEVVKALKELQRNPHEPEQMDPAPIPIVGLIKLHGTHADILVHHDDTIVLQSKNVANITLANDNQGFAAAMADKAHVILSLRDRYIARWKELNPTLQLDPQHPVLVAGEWIGMNIQKDVAISRLSRRFVIISANINNSWVQDNLYSSIECPSSAIYNISRGGAFHATLYPQDIARTLAEVEPLAEAVAASCPFAASLDSPGEGEGIVWKPSSSYNAYPSLWFKTKGGRFKPTFIAAPKFIPVDQQAKRDAADKVAAIWCTDERLQQGWDYLEEVSVQRNMKALGRYLRWVQGDILVEEKGHIDEYNIDEGILRISIARIAKAWYIRRVGLGEG